jgi:hypothetical protein
VWYLVSHPSSYNITFHLHKNISIWILCLSVNNFYWNVSMFGVPSHRIKLGQIHFLKISHTQHIWQDKINNMFQVKHVAYFTLPYMLCMIDLGKKKCICNSKHNRNGSSQNSYVRWFFTIIKLKTTFVLGQSPKQQSTSLQYDFSCLEVGISRY